MPIIPNSKQAFIKGWNHFNKEGVDDLDVLGWLGQYPDYAVGFPVPKSIAVVDVDITDRELAHKVGRLALTYLGKTPLVRVGAAPKHQLWYKQAGDVVTRRPHPIEIFGGTGFVCMFGLHSTTKKPYRWLRNSPLDMRPDDPAIPLVDATSISLFLEAAKPLVEPLRVASGRVHTVRGTNGRTLHTESIKDHIRRRSEIEGTSRACAMALRECRAGGRHDTLMTVIGILYREGWNAERIEAFCLHHWHAPRGTHEITRAVQYACK